MDYRNLYLTVLALTPLCYGRLYEDIATLPSLEYDFVITGGEH